MTTRSGFATGADRNRSRGADIVEAQPALRDPWSTARSAEIFGSNDPGPVWPKAEMVTFNAEVDPATAKLWLPPPLEAPARATAMVFLARYPMTKLGFGYNEAAVFLHGTHAGKPYMHCTWMVVDDDTALILGRDMLGFPKKMAVIDANVHGASPGGRVERKGMPVLEVFGSNVTSIDPALAEQAGAPIPVVNVLGGVRGGATLVERTEAIGRHWAKAVDLEISFGQSDLDPLYRLGMASKQKGVVTVVDLGVPGGEGEPAADSLTGTTVPADWMTKAYPFRVW